MNLINNKIEPNDLINYNLDCNIRPTDTVMMS